MRCSMWARVAMAGAPIGLAIGTALGQGVSEPAAVATVRVVAPSDIASADALLTALETADQSLTSLQCNLVYDKRFSLQEDQHIRLGKLYFATEKGKGDARPTKTFAVVFDTLILDGASRPEKLSMVFDGEWLLEKREAEKQWVARQLAPPEAPIDPLRLGEGPLPIPIGQPKAEILARFDASLLPYDDGFQNAVEDDLAYRDFVAGCWQLLLLPKSDTPDAERFSEIRLWYSRDEKGRILPRMAFTIDRKGDESFVQLIGTQINKPLPDGVIDMTEPDPASGWDVQRDFGRFDEPMEAE